MVLAFFIALLVFWWLLWGIFHLAGGPIHFVLAAAFLVVLYRTIQASNVAAASALC